MVLQQTDDFETLSILLNKTLSDKNSFIPHVNGIPKIKSKGIYFWFMRSDGYKQLSNFVEIAPIVPALKRTFDEIEYDLVYLGTAGTGKKGYSNFEERFVWHIDQNHSGSNICHGTLSTLRAGLGALLSADLILPTTENMVNEFMAKFMKLYWIEYPEDKALIDNDEKILIVGIRPLLNLKNNPNARGNAIDNSTQTYKQRRSRIYESTRQRLACSRISQAKMKRVNNVNAPIVEVSNYHHQLIEDSKDTRCVDFFVLEGQNIAEVIYGIEGLPLGKCTFQIYESKNPSNILFPKWKRTGNNVIFNPNAQNIYTYFANVDGVNGYRWEQIFKKMEDDEIDEITIRVCKVN